METSDLWRFAFTFYSFIGGNRPGLIPNPVGDGRGLGGGGGLRGPFPNEQNLVSINLRLHTLSMELQCWSNRTKY